MIVLDILSIILIIVLFGAAVVGAAVVGVYQCEKKEAGKKNEKHNL
jgi:flagellar basal body-associated protein FliL